MWQAWTTGFLGLWLIMTPFMTMGRSDTLMNSLAIGLVGGLAGWLVRKECPIQGWCEVLVAVWVVAGMFLPGIREGSSLHWSSVVSGIVLAIAGFTILAGGRPTHRIVSR